jgi:capsular exopolysaccharide synthesis family protein
MDFRQLGRALRANILVMAAVFLIVVVLGGAAASLPANKYQASTLLLAEPVSSTDPSGEIVAIQYFQTQLAVEVSDRSVLEKVSRQVPARYANADVSVEGAADLGSGTLTITANSPSPQASAAWANADARILIGLEKHTGVFTLVQPSPALVPVKPSNPRKEILLGSFAFALIASVFAALGAAAIRRRLSQVDEARETLGLPVLAEVPRVGRNAMRPSQIFGTDAQPMLLEAFQELRSNLLLALPADRPAAIAVISGEPGEGKSSVATDLAWALASESRPVTAVDCDLRKPTMHLLLGAAVGPGVSGRKTLSLDQLLSPTRNPHLNFIPAGIPDRHPVDIVSSYVPSLLAELEQAGRHVVVDCPPLTGVAEAPLLATLVDVVVLVVDARHFDPIHVQQYQARLQEAGATVIGVVLNRVRASARFRKGSYGYGLPSPVLGTQSLAAAPEAPSNGSVRAPAPPRPTNEQTTLPRQAKPPTRPIRSR